MIQPDRAVRMAVAVPLGRLGPCAALRDRLDVDLPSRPPARFKTALVRTAQHENRSQANLREALVFEFCRLKGIEVPGTPANQQD